MATTTVTPAPLVVKDAILTLSLNGTDDFDYSAAVGTAKYTPNVTTSIFTGIGGQRVVQIGDVAWTLEIGYPQDWDTANSLSTFLNTNQGSTATAVLTPATGGDAATATVLLVPGGIGGTYGQQADETVSLPCTTAPVVA